MTELPGRFFVAVSRHRVLEWPLADKPSKGNGFILKDVCCVSTSEANHPLKRRYLRLGGDPVVNYSLSVADSPRILSASGK